MNTGNFDGKDSPATGVNTTPSKVGIPPCGKVNRSEKNTEKDTIRTSDVGIENSFSNSVEEDTYETGKNENLGHEATGKSVIPTNDNNNSSIELKFLAKLNSNTEYLIKQEGLLNETIDLKSSTRLENTSSHVVHTQPIYDSTENVNSFSNVTGQDVVEKILDHWDIKNFECEERSEKNTAISLSLKEEVHNDSVVEKEMRNVLGGSSFDCEKQNKILDDALVLDCQPVTEENINHLSSGPSGTSLESNIDNACTEETQLVDVGMTVEEKIKSNQQLYSLDSMKIELTNVKNCLNKANLHDEEKDDNSESSDLEESSGTTTTSTESDDEASSSSTDR